MYSQTTMLGVWTDSLVHLVVAFILAPPIGWNRARAELGAGLRTFPLFAKASCGLVQAAISVLGADAPSQAEHSAGHRHWRRLHWRGRHHQAG
jgi:uncharacterized membrane protein YhiD involved in acid resistance